jgi:hypothetical protein
VEAGGGRAAVTSDVVTGEKGLVEVRDEMRPWGLKGMGKRERSIPEYSENRRFTYNKQS